MITFIKNLYQSYKSWDRCRKLAYINQRLSALADRLEAHLYPNGGGPSAA